jgi:hypothetical protein
MNKADAQKWLDARGGSWYVRATSALCVVVAMFGTARVVVRASRLSADAVEDALETAVDELRTIESHTIEGRK